MSSNSLSRSLERLPEAQLINRLEEIVERAYFERIYGILVESSHENHRRHVFGTDRRDDVEAIELGHLDIEEDKIRLEVANCRNRLSARLALAENHHVGNSAE